MRRWIIAFTLLAACRAQAATPEDHATSARALRAAPVLDAIDGHGVKCGRGATTTIYDSLTGAASLLTTGASPRTFMSSPFTVAASGPTVTVDEATVYLAATAAQSFSNGLLIQIQFWDAFDFNLSPIFGAAVGGVRQFTVPGPVSLPANTFTPINVAFVPPLVLNDLTGGFAVNYQGDNGGGFTSTDALTSLIRGNGALAVGAIPASGAYAGPQFGFFRNVAGQTTFNFAPSDRRTFTGVNDIVLALQLRQAVTPVELQSFRVE